MAESFAEDARGRQDSSPREAVAPSRRDYIILLVAAAALQAIAWLLIYRLLVTNRVGYVPWLGSDTAYYADRGLRVMGGQWPYAGFRFEYPPLSLLLFVLPPLKGTLATYHTWFGAQMMIIGAGSAIITTTAAVRIWRGIGRPFAVASALALTTMAAGAVAIDRFDGAVALVLAGVVLCLVYERWALAAALTGVGFALKLVPIVVLPLVLVLARRRRSVVWVAALAAVFAVAPFVPFLLHDAHSLATDLFGMQAGRGLHIESVPASPFLFVRLFRPEAVHIVIPFASLTVDGPGIGTATALAPAFVLALLAGVGVAVWRSRGVLRTSRESIPPAVLACILAALCGNKVLSPQHLLWIIPLVALCLAGPRLLPRIAAVLLLVAMVLTQVEYPGMYYRQVDLEQAALLVLIVRNAMLAAAFIVLWTYLWRLRDERAGCPVHSAQRSEPAA